VRKYLLLLIDDPIHLEIHSPVLLLLQKIRDEAHRFTIEYQKVRRSKSTIKSALDMIPGIGPLKKNRLIRKYGSVKAMVSLSAEELMEVKGITKKDAENIQKYLKGICTTVDI
jgi:excinuclease ABC subunit C